MTLVDDPHDQGEELTVPLLLNPGSQKTREFLSYDMNMRFSAMCAEPPRSRILPRILTLVSCACEPEWGDASMPRKNSIHCYGGSSFRLEIYKFISLKRRVLSNEGIVGLAFVVVKKVAHIINRKLVASMRSFPDFLVAVLSLPSQT